MEGLSDEEVNGAVMTLVAAGRRTLSVDEGLVSHGASCIMANCDALVCGGAAGFDIVVCETWLHVRGDDACITLVLPGGRATFRERSVVDRGKEWGTRFDALLARVERSSRGVVVEWAECDYMAANVVILDRGASLGRPMIALVGWDNRHRGAEDVTAHFERECERRGLQTRTLYTVDVNADLPISRLGYDLWRDYLFVLIPAGDIRWSLAAVCRSLRDLCARYLRLFCKQMGISMRKFPLIFFPPSHD